MIEPLPDYQNLDLSGEALQAATRMEARAQESASQDLFQHLVAPLLTAEVKTVLEFGCGTAALARKMARAAPHTLVYASDKSAGMLQVAQRMVEAEQLTNLHLRQWDVLDERAFPFSTPAFDLIIASVVLPYLDDAQTRAVIEALAARLAPGGTLAFVEQDLMTDSVNFPRFDLFCRILSRDTRRVKPTIALGLRPCLRAAGLRVLPRRSFLWTDDAYGPYLRDLLERFAASACDKGHIQPEEKAEWLQTLAQLAEADDFYYGLVYHLIAGQRR